MLAKGAKISEMSAEILRFPEGFFWGTAASARGVEEDLEPLKSLGTNTHRLSIQWSRLEPDEGIWAKDAVEYYVRVLGFLKSNGIVPFVTLHHCTIPSWLAKSGGWESERAVEAFEGYVRRAVRSFGAHVQHWVTMNAPVLYAYRGYVAGSAPPGARSLRRALRVCRNLIRAHVRAYHAIHDEAEKIGLTAQVGLAKYFRIFDPLLKSSVWDGLAARMRDDFFNKFVLNSLHAGVMVFPFGFNRYVPEMERCFDFIGVNYYTRELIRFRPWRPLDLFGESIASAAGIGSSSGYEIYPEGLRRVLESVARFGKPVYITENGVATDDADVRCRFIVSHLKQVYDVIQLGGDVRGYFHCSLVDGFGRQANASGHLYGRICAENGLPTEMVRQYSPQDLP